MSIKDNGREKKAFDSTVCFTFYGSWVEAIADLETDVDKDSAACQTVSWCQAALGTAMGGAR